MNKLYKYSGTVFGYSYNPRGCGSADIILGDITDWDIPPVRVEAFSELAKYIREIEGTDAEERYIKADWYYDRNLRLHRIEIPSTNPSIPAKIITQDDLLRSGLEIFGPRDYIEDSNPEPMNKEELHRWYEYRSWSSQH